MSDLGIAGGGVIIFGAKKLKNGVAVITSSSQPESKDREWKDKEAVGKILKTGTTYVGRLSTLKDHERSYLGSVSQDSYSNQNEGILLSSADIDYGQRTHENNNSLDNSPRSGPLAVSIDCSGVDKLIQASVVVVDAINAEKFLEGKINAYNCRNNSKLRSNLGIALLLEFQIDFIFSILRQ
jgi:hypothetical protein